MKLYIAGPIKGKADKNESAFRLVERKLQSLGYTTIVPLDIPPHKHEGNCPGNTSEAGEGEHKSGCYMRNDIIAMLKCDGIILLDGWENFAGARIEFLTAQACGLEIKYQSDNFKETI